MLVDRVSTSWLKLKSWHAIWRADAVSTVCGKPLDRAMGSSATLPLSQKSCESCLRITRHREELQRQQNSLLDEHPVVPA
jgi:hypothetical protein